MHGDKPAFDFEPKGHVDLCDALGLIDFERGTKLSGSGFLLYTGWGARLERAMIQYLLDLHVHEHGYTEVSPPFMVQAECMEGMGQFPKFLIRHTPCRKGWTGRRWVNVISSPQPKRLWQTCIKEILSETDLPKYYCACPCFRAEAGAAGVATRGMIRAPIRQGGANPGGEAGRRL